MLKSCHISDNFCRFAVAIAETLRRNPVTYNGLIFHCYFYIIKRQEPRLRDLVAVMYSRTFVVKLIFQIISDKQCLLCINY